MHIFFLKLRFVWLWLFRNKTMLRKRTEQVLNIAKKAAKYTKSEKDDKALVWTGKALEKIFSMLPEEEAAKLAKEVTDSDEKSLRGVVVDVTHEKAGVSISGERISTGISYDFEKKTPTFGINIKL